MVKDIIHTSTVQNLMQDYEVTTSVNINMFFLTSGLVTAA